jgi:hypothetical protein
MSTGQAAGRRLPRPAWATRCWRAAQRPRWRPAQLIGRPLGLAAIRRAARSRNQSRHPGVRSALALPGTKLAATMIAALLALLADPDSPALALRWSGAHAAHGARWVAACRVHPLGWGLPPLGMGWVASFSRSTVVSTMAAGDGGDRHGRAVDTGEITAAEAGAGQPAARAAGWPGWGGGAGGDGRRPPVRGGAAAFPCRQPDDGHRRCHSD